MIILCTSSKERTLVTNGINFHIKSEKKTYYEDKSYVCCGLMGYDITQFYRLHQCLERTYCFHPHITSNMKTETVRPPMSDISPAKLRDMPEDQNLNFNRCENNALILYLRNNSDSSRNRCLKELTNLG